jgi:hypothetical protein
MPILNQMNQAHMLPHCFTLQYYLPISASIFGMVSFRHSFEPKLYMRILSLPYLLFVLPSHLSCFDHHIFR